MCKDKQLEVFLTEYKELRNHINENKNHQLRIFTIIISALGVIYGIIFAYDKAHDLILILPLLVLTLGLRFQYEKYGVYVISKYLEDLEKNIKNIIKFQEWQGYQNTWMKHKYETDKGKCVGKIYDYLPVWLLFIFIPMIISIVYSFFIYNRTFTNVNGLPNEIYIISAVLYGLIIFLSPFFVNHINNLSSQINTQPPKNDKQNHPKEKKNEKNQTLKIKSKELLWLRVCIPWFFRNHKFTTGLLIIDFVLFILLFPTQQFIFIILSFIFYITLTITIVSILVISIRTLIEKKHKSKSTIKSRVISIKITTITIIIVLLLIFSYPLFAVYIAYIPNFKGFINEGYLQETVNEIIEGKSTDYERIGAVLEWFDDDKNNLYDSWVLTHSGKPWFNPPGTYIIFLTEEPFICIRCFEENNARWLLTSRCGACGEYSRLFMIMADYLGYDVRRIHAPGEDHLWNEIKINGVWIPVDPTNVSLLKGGDGWEDYTFFEAKEGNVSYVWAEYLYNDTIIDRTSFYTGLTNVTIHCVDESNNSISDVTITIMSNNLHDKDRIHETYIKGKAKPRTNESGYCTFQIGGGTYKFKANNDRFTGETEWIKFSDEISLQSYLLVVNNK